MTTETIAAIISAAAAALSVLGAAFAWWRANLSSKARDAADDARRRAEDQARNARAQVEHLERLATQTQTQSEAVQRIADATNPARLEIRREGQWSYSLWNNTGNYVVVESIQNPERWSMLLLELPATIEARASVPFRISHRSVDKQPPEHLELDLIGEDDSVTVRMPPRDQ